MSWLISFAWAHLSCEECETSENYKMKNSSQHLDLNLVPSAYEVDKLPILLQDLIYIEHLKVDRILPGCVIVVPRFSRKHGDIKSHSSFCPFVCLSVRLSQKLLTWLISSEVLVIEHWYLACMILVTSPFQWYHAVALTFDLLQGQICCRAGDHNSSNLLV